MAKPTKKVSKQAFNRPANSNHCYFNYYLIFRFIMSTSDVRSDHSTCKQCHNWPVAYIIQRTLTVGNSYHWTAGLQFNKTGLDQKRKYILLFVCYEAVESKLVKLETSCTVIPIPIVSVLCYIIKPYFKSQIAGFVVSFFILPITALSFSVVLFFFISFILWQKTCRCWDSNRERWVDANFGS